MENGSRLFGLLALIVAVCASLTFPGGAWADKTVTDELGRSIILPDDPRRIVALAPSITEIVFSLKQGHRLVGVTQFSNYPEQALRLPKVGSYVNLNVEKIVALEPDLCIATKDGNPIDVIRVLESLQIPVYAVDPRDLVSVMETIRTIGGLLDAEKEADSLLSQMKQRIDRVRRLVSGISARPRVFCQIGISPVVSAGSNTCLDGLIDLAGGINLAKGPASYPRFSIEQVLALAPDILIITSMTRGETFEQVKAQWLKWPQMPAARNKRIVLVDSDLVDRPSPRLVDGLERLTAVIHPETAKEFQ
jgi:iron complex transport system substrate-binding protein